MSAAKSIRAARRGSRARKSSLRRTRKAPRRPLKSARAAAGAVPLAVPQLMYRLCKTGWAVIVERSAAGVGTRFVCPFCPVSHRVPGPVRGFRKMRRSQWIKLRRVAD